MPIRSFATPRVEAFFRTGRPPRRAGWSSIARTASRKLDLLDYAKKLEDLRPPPGNRLEALRVDLEGSYSIRINERWRVIFRWTPNGPRDVDAVDYH